VADPDEPDPEDGEPEHAAVALTKSDDAAESNEG
jgi:hypothetical protein